VQKVADIRAKFIQKYKDQDFVTDKTGVKTVEMIGAQFVADEPLIFGSLNHDYIDRELEWYKSMSLNVNDIPGKVPEIWKQVCDESGYIHSNYGWCVWSDKNGRQYEHVRDELIKNPNSRRAVMIYTRPTMHQIYNINGMSDFMCTNTVQYFIRENVLSAYVSMRSNDVVFGYRNDYAWQKHVLEELGRELGIETGDIIWNCGSLHVYQRHFNLIKSTHI
jgi:thymidylate synthase